MRFFSFVALGLLYSISVNASDALDLEKGAKHYQRCAACHMANGKGVPGAFPPLVERFGKHADSETLREYLVGVIDKGIAGPISVAGVRYQGFMPPQGANVSNADMAQLINYIFKKFNAETLTDDWAIDAKEVSEIRSRTANLSGQELIKLRDNALAGGAVAQDLK